MKAKTTNEIVIEPARETAPDTPAPTVLTFGRLPREINLFGEIPTVYAQAAVLIRQGFVFNMACPPIAFPATGQVSMFLHLGSPDAVAVANAIQATDEALAAEEADFQARVQAAAKKIVEDAAKAARDAELQAKLAETRAQIAALEASLK